MSPQHKVGGETKLMSSYMHVVPVKHGNYVQGKDLREDLRYRVTLSNDLSDLCVCQVKFPTFACLNQSFKYIIRNNLHMGHRPNGH